MSDESYDVEIESRSFSIPEWLLKADMPSNAKIAYAALHAAALAGNKAVGRRYLREWLHCSESTVSRATKDLEIYGAMKVLRDAKPTGRTGRMITRNTYYLRTTDPHVTHVLPAQSRPHTAYPTGGLGRIRPPSKGLEDLPPPPVPAKPHQRSFKAVVATLTDTQQAALGDLLNLAAQLRQIRRDDLGKSDRSFSDVNVARAAVDAIDAGHDPTLIPAALTALARDPDTIVPQRLRVAGRWWDEALTEARRARRTDQFQERATAIADCDRCDEYGFVPPDFDVRCLHTVEATA